MIKNTLCNLPQLPRKNTQNRWALCWRSRQSRFQKLISPQISVECCHSRQSAQSKN
jgi:hypothetical protein